ncbi:hypothetical protein HYG81_05385 [Natrinema zhouii]|uniref:Uncharacterized protein n=1 Tax=Natrinema zhouii TaxID=1710539 RepID=A0A7D6GSM8_9EURY|nr:hypothetical protein [Natrinema zhouii]QLK27043.1 hypothetical protein HYG81_05385 [Natrinema zhouii]
MSKRDPTTETGDSSTTESEHSESKFSRESVSRALQSVRGGIESGLPAGIGGGVSLLRGVRALRRGEREHGVGQLVLSGVLLAVAIAQRRSDERRGARSDIDQTDVVSTGPEIDDLEERDAGGGRHTGDEAQRVAGTSIDIEDVDSSPDPESDVDAAEIDQTDVVETGTDEERLADVATESAESDSETGDLESESDGPESESATAESESESPDSAESESDRSVSAEIESTESYERLGAAAFDEHSSELPVPQRAFDQNILSLSSEAFWGIREDDAVFVSQEFDPIQDADGIRYVASTEIDGERTLTIPDTVLNHWDSVAGGGMAVAGGDEIVFVTADSLQADSQIRVVPEQWVDDVLEDNE